jgi:orotate phosphoribosyltransferase
VQEIRSRLKALIQEKCVLRGDFILASGQRSKVFFDLKRITLDPEGVHLIATLILDLIDDLARKDGRPIDALGGPTIGADPIVGHVAGLSWARASQARSTDAHSPGGSPTAASGPLPGAPAGGNLAPAPDAPSHGQARPIRGFLVRKEEKDHGTRRIIENEIPRGSRVVVFEDVVTTGSSTLQAVRKAVEAGLEVAAIVSLVDRDQGGAEALSRYRYIPLFTKSEFGL